MPAPAPGPALGGTDARLAGLRVLVVGCGAMGRRHARVVAADPSCELLTYDLHPERAHAAGGRAVAEIPADIDVAIVATPTATHRAVAEPLLARGVWCLVEKPLADTLEGARALAAWARCGCGLSERYNRAVRAAGPVRARAVEVHRLAPADGRVHDTDVILDLMIHDLDLALRWLGPAEVRSAEASLTGDAASARVEMADGRVVACTASREATHRRRWARVATEGGAVALDLLAGRAWRGADERVDPDPADALTAQWAAWTRVVRGGPREEPGLAAVELAWMLRQRARARG